MLVALIGCYGPTFPEGRPCTGAGDCPQGQMCAADNKCYSNSGPGSIDAPVAYDAPVSYDAPPGQPDAAPPLIDAPPSTIDAGPPTIDSGAPTIDASVSCNSFGSTAFTEYNGVCYVLFYNQLPWQQAQDDCASRGGNLVSIGDSQENDIVRQLDPGDAKWLGGQRSGGSFQWADGDPFLFTNWNSTEPNNTGDCVRMGQNGGGSSNRWFDTPCSDPYWYVCEF